VALECDGLVVEYASGGYLVRPVDGLTFEVNSSELGLLLGPSGCGKTTVLSVLAGILRPAAGRVLLQGKDVAGLTGRALAAYRLGRVGVVFQAFNLIPSLSAAENVEVPLLAAGMGRAQSRARAAALLGQVGLGERAQHRPAELSGGEQQRVAMARALALDPPLLIADEPTAHLDYVQVDAVLRLLRAIADEGRIVIAATHDERLIPLAERVIDLHQDVPEEELHSARIGLSAGDVLFEQGDRGDYVYVVESGEVEILRRLADGGAQLLDTVRPGRYFGELAPVLKLRRSATARARTDAVVVALTAQEFRRGAAEGAVTRATPSSGVPGARRDGSDLAGAHKKQ
jgi:putative ABC transport system ATP-binding protein